MYDDGDDLFFLLLSTCGDGAQLSSTLGRFDRPQRNRYLFVGKKSIAWVELINQRIVYVGL